MILFHVSIAVLWLTEICRRIVACRCIAKGDTHSHLMNINKIENSALNTNFKVNERKKTNDDSNKIKRVKIPLLHIQTIYYYKEGGG